MKKINPIQMAIAVVAFVLMLVFPYFHFSFLGFSMYSFIPLNCATGLYPVFLVPIIGMLVLIFLSFNELKPVSMIAGGIMILIHIIFGALSDEIILSGDIQVLLNKVGNIMKEMGINTNVGSAELKLVLQPLLKPHLCYYVTLVLNAAYIVAGLVGSAFTGSGAGHSSRAKSSASHGRRF